MRTPRRKRILVPVTLAEGSRAALAFAVRIAQACAGEILLLHAVPPGLAGEERAAERELTQLASGVTNSQVPMDICVAEGHPAPLIVETAKAISADAILMTTRRPGRLARWLHRNTARQVLEQAPCPVWTLSAGKDRNTVRLMLVRPGGESEVAQQPPAGLAARALLLATWGEELGVGTRNERPQVRELQTSEAQWQRAAWKFAALQVTLSLDSLQ